METNEPSPANPAAGAGLIPAHFAKVSIPQAHRTINILAQTRTGVRKQPSEDGLLELVYLPGGKKIIIIDGFRGQAWADPEILTNEHP